MKQREKRNIIIGILCCMLVFMGVGYAALQQVLNINGTAKVTGDWNVKITAISPIPGGTNGGKSVNALVTNDGQGAEFEATLLKPSSAVEYTVTVENKGTIDAELVGIISDWENTGEIKFSTLELDACKSLPAESGEASKCNFKVKVEYLDTGANQELPEEREPIRGSFVIEYKQAGMGEFGTESVPGDGKVEAEESDFLVTRDGMLLSYMGTNPDVVVPAEVNGIKIRKIAPAAFNKTDFILLTFTDGQKAVITNDEKANEIRELSTRYEIAEYPREEVATNLFSSNLVSEDYIVPHIMTESGPINEVDDNLEFHHITSLDLSQMIYLEEIDDHAIYGYNGDSDECGTQNSHCGLGTLMSLKLPMNGVLHTIGESAFSYNQLTTIEFPESLTLIGRGAFEYNKITGNITIPANVTKIDRYAFQDNNLTSATILGDKTRFDSNWSGSADSIFDTGVKRLPE